VWLIKQGTLCLELAVLSLVHPVVCFCHSVSELRSDMSTLPIQPNLCILTQGTLPVLGILHKQVGKIKYGTCIIVFQLTIYIALLNYHIVKVQTQILYQEVSFAHGVAPRTIQFFIVSLRMVTFCLVTSIVCITLEGSDFNEKALLQAFILVTPICRVLGIFMLMTHSHTKISLYRSTRLKSLNYLIYLLANHEVLFARFFHQGY